MDSELLRWVWAISEQLAIFDRHDAKWLDQNQKGEWTACEHGTCHEFLKKYSLLRGKKGAVFSGANCKTRRYLLALSQKVYSPALPTQNCTEEVARRWEEVDHMLCPTKLGRSFRKPQDGELQMPSLTLKLFWFYQPKYVPMYDQYIVKGLRKNTDLKASHSAADFFKSFFDFADEKKTNLAEAQKYIPRIYPYKYRVVDKYLWLIGSGREKEILENFSAGWKAVPYQSG